MFPLICFEKFFFLLFLFFGGWGGNILWLLIFWLVSWYKMAIINGINTSKKIEQRLTVVYIFLFNFHFSSHTFFFSIQGSRDNMSVVLVCLPNAPKVSEEAVKREADLDKFLESHVEGKRKLITLLHQHY